jgi:hypothetical protein
LSRTNLVLLGGLTAILGGVLHVVLNVLHFAVMMALPYDFVLRGLFNFSLDVIGVGLALFFALSVVGLYVLAGRRAPLGLLGLVLAGLSVLASASYVVFAIAYILYKATIAADQTGPPPDMVFPELAFDRAEDLLLAASLLLVGLVALRVRALGRLSALPLVLAVLVLPIPFALGRLLDLSWSFLISFTVLQGAAWVFFGGALWASAPEPRVSDAREAPAG